MGSGCVRALMLLGMLTVSGCTGTAGTSEKAAPRVIVIVGDGVGTGHWTVARIAAEHLAVEDFAAFGLVDTRGWNHLVSGSAPTGTAYATGTRSFMGAVGVGPDSLPRASVLEFAQQRGMSTGLITTTRLTDATPASFAAHYPRRDDVAIAAQMAVKDVTVLLGGGRDAFGRARIDSSTTALDAMRRRYAYVESADQLDALDLDTVPGLLGLFADADMPLAPQRTPSLSAMTRTALEILDRNPAGFFLLVENEETDTQAHHNEPYEVIAAEMLDLDATIRTAVAYRDRHPETLIVVTGDHEAGGLSVLANDSGGPELRYTTAGHSAAMLPIFAVGPGAERFAGIHANDAVGRALIESVRR
jgi:alkaline phosphatase